MKKGTAGKRHPPHDTRPAPLVVALLFAGACGCGHGLPRPVPTQVATADYVAVPFPPRPPPVEFIPPPPPGRRDAVWIDGSWEWQNNRFTWRFGTWLVPPVGARRTEWVVVRRKVDGQLFFAPSAWKDAKGAALSDASFRNALGGAARARTRVGGPAADPLDSLSGTERSDTVTTSETEE